METTTSHSSEQLIADAYKELHELLFFYIRKIVYGKISDEDIKDLVQDTFLRLLDYRRLLERHTVRSFVFTIARNLLVDRMRHLYIKEEADAYMKLYGETCTRHTESIIIADDLRRLEARRAEAFPVQRRKIYELHRFEDRTIEEISQELNVSVRTVQNHLQLGRAAMREYMRNCI